MVAAVWLRECWQLGLSEKLVLRLKPPVWPNAVGPKVLSIQWQLFGVDLKKIDLFLAA